MILSDKTIRELIRKKELIIEGMNDQSVQPASVDLRLSNKFKVVNAHMMSVVDLDNPIEYRNINVDEIIIPPKSFVLGTTIEKITLPANISAFVEGRSSIGRTGLFIQNAGWIDPGYSGRITLQMYNSNPLPIKIRKGRRVCQIVFCMMDQEVENAYSGKYQGEESVGESRIYLDKH